MEEHETFKPDELQELDDEAEAVWVRSLHGKGVRELRWWQKVLLIVVGPFIEMMGWFLVVAVLVEGLCIRVKNWRRDG